MELQEIRETFREASIIVARNGISVSYPPRNNAEYRNAESIKSGNAVFLELLQSSKEFCIEIGNAGFTYTFSFDGSPLEKVEVIPAYQEPVTWQMIKEKRPPRNDIAKYRFDKYFNGVNASDEYDIRRRMDGFLSEFETEIDPMTCEEERRWELLQKRFAMLHRYFPEFEVDNDFRTIDVMIGSSDLPNREVSMIGLPLMIFTEMVKLSTELDFNYSCRNSGGAVSIVFVV